MPSEVDLCNGALGHLGDVANVSAISPPDGSAQAMHCARFYPAARDALLEMHDWRFATCREPLALFSQSVGQWAYAYAAPDNMICARKVLDADAPDDWSVGINNSTDLPGYAPGGTNFGSAMGLYTPQPFIVETTESGADVIYTNQPNAVLQFTRRVVDPTKFSPLFCSALEYLLASRLAGPIIKGSEGRAVAKEMLQMGMGFLQRATVSDANQRRLDIAVAVPWMVGR